MNKDKGDDIALKDVGFEEGLVEFARTDLNQGDVVDAYKQHGLKVGKVADATKKTRGELVQLFKDGENAELNALFDVRFDRRAA